MTERYELNDEYDPLMALQRLVTGLVKLDAQGCGGIAALAFSKHVGAIGAE